MLPAGRGLGRRGARYAASLADKGAPLTEGTSLTDPGQSTCTWLRPLRLALYMA